MMMSQIEYRIRNLYLAKYRELSGWNVGETLGSGSKGQSLVVKLTRPGRRGGEEVRALKVVQALEPMRGTLRQMDAKRLEDTKERYLSEIKAMRRLSDAEYVMDLEWAMIDEWECDGYYGCDLLILMPYKQCLRLRDERLRMTCETAVQVGKDICKALMECHARGIIHRDIKPSNVFVEKRGDETRYLLGDFGIAKITDGHNVTASTGIGTEIYAAPEQYRASTPYEKMNYTEKVDIYCLGLSLYELCNDGLLPFSRQFPPYEDEVQRRVRGQEPLPPPRAAKEKLSDIILKACAYKAEERYQSAEELLDALESLGADDMETLVIASRQTDRKPDLDETLPARPDYEIPEIQSVPRNAAEKPKDLPPLDKALAWLKERKKRIAVIGAALAALALGIAVAVWWRSVGAPPELPDEVRLALGESYPAPLKPDGKRVSWSSTDEAIASVDENGVITANGKGSAEISAKDALGRADVCRVWVDNRLISLTVTPGDAALDVGQTLQLSAEPFPQDAAVREFTWSSSRPEIVSVTQDGLLTAHQVGEAVITVSGGDCSGKCGVKALAVVKSVTLTEREKTIAQGKSETLTAIISPSEAAGHAVSWSSSDESVAIVEASGKVTGLKQGQAVITASCGGQSAECVVAVIVEVEKITLDRSTLSIAVGEKRQISASITPSNATNQTIRWTSGNESVATVDASGNVTGKARGTATIEAFCGDKRASCTVTVTPDPSAESSSNTSSGNSSSNTSSGASSSGASSGGSSSGTGSGGSSSNGNSGGSSSSKSSGGSSSNASSGNSSGASAPASVSATKITLNPSSLSLKEGEKQTIRATVEPSNATDKTITWSVDNRDVATVSQTGVVAAGSQGGNATVTATCGNAKATCSVYVSVPVKDIELSPASLELTAGASGVISATVKPDNATDKTIQWSSSNPQTAAVDSGRVYAVSPGSAVITASCGGVSKTCAVTVVPVSVPATGVEILDEEGNAMDYCVAFIGEVLRLTARVSPDNATDKTVVWTSSNPSVASVDENGVVTVLAAGEDVVIKASCGEVQSSFQLTGWDSAPEPLPWTDEPIEIPWTEDGAEPEETEEADFADGVQFDVPWV